MKMTTLRVKFLDGDLFWRAGTPEEIKSKEVLTARLTALLSKYQRATINEHKEERLERGYKMFVRIISVTTHEGSYLDHFHPPQLQT